MRLHTAADDGDTGEPDDGWQEAPALADSVRLNIVLCVFTGQPPALDSRGDTYCQAREDHRHPLVDCWQSYVMAKAITTLSIPEVLVLADRELQEQRFPASWFEL